MFWVFKEMRVRGVPCNFGSFVVSNLIKWVQLNKLREMGAAEHNVQQLLSQFQVSLFDIQLTE